MGDELIIEFLNWLTDGGRMQLKYTAREGHPDELWLGAKQVSRSDLARIARHWSKGGDLSQETAGVLVVMALKKVEDSKGREWHHTK